MNPQTNPSVVGIFDSKHSIETARNKLTEEGFKSENISIILPEKINNFKNEKAHDRVISGAVKGFVIGANLGMVVGSVMFLLPIFAAGAIFSSLFIAGVGGILGGVIGLSSPKSMLNKYKHTFTKEKFILLVQGEGPDWIRRAKKLLENSGAHDIAYPSDLAGA